jgi:hypothetical protein
MTGGWVTTNWTGVGRSPSEPQEYALKELDYSKMTEKDRKQILAEV